MGKIKCRTCRFSKENYLEAKKHILCTTDFKCVLCSKPTKWYSHYDDDSGLVGDALECKSCHNFIIYVIPDINPETEEHYLKVWKDETYLFRKSKDVLVLRSYEDNTTAIIIDDVQKIFIEGILHFDSSEHLMKRIESIIVFS
jgi:hypothetical protein